MALPIFFSQQIDNTEFITLNEETSRHIVQVLRMKPQEPLQLTDGQGNLVTAIVADDHKKKSTVKVLERQFKANKTRQVCIGISLLKNASRFEWFLEKATEIGITEIVPLLCDRTEKQHFRHDRMNAILVAAMLQSQQYWLPVLHEPTLFRKAIDQSSAAIKLIAHCEHDTRQSIKDFNSNSTQILIGPEGDFSRDEIDLALQQNYQPVMLGDTRLRTETAGVAAATLLCI